MAVVQVLLQHLISFAHSAKFFRIATVVWMATLHGFSVGLRQMVRRSIRTDAYKRGCCTYPIDRHWYAAHFRRHEVASEVHKEPRALG